MNDRYVRTRLAVVAATVLLGTTCGGFTALAAPAANPAGTGDGVAIGTGSWAPKAEHVLNITAVSDSLRRVIL